MELKNNKRNPTTSNGTSHFTESNAGHISVKTTSPFLNRMKDSEFNVSKQNKSKKNQSACIINKKLPKDMGSGTSKMLINQILGDSSIDRDVMLNLNKPFNEKNLSQIEQKCNYIQNLLVNNIECKYSSQTLTSKSFSMQHGLCSKEDSINQSKSYANNENLTECYTMNNATTFCNITEKNCAEKKTYCRPARNQEFINKTLEQNKKLYKLVNQLILARKKEKQTEAWNNYINDLKNKHGYGDSARNSVSGRYVFEESKPLEYIDDYYNTQFITKQATPCKALLNDFYNACNTGSPYYNHYNPNIDDRHRRSYQPKKYASFNDRSNCYPISSQGRLMMLSRDKSQNPYAADLKNYPNSRRYHGNTIHVEKEPISKNRRTEFNNQKDTDISLRSPCNLHIIAPTKNCPCNEEDYFSPMTNSSAQTDTVVGSNDLNEMTTSKNIQKEPLEDSYRTVTDNVKTLKHQIHETCNKQSLLESIESKLDSLLTSINSFIDEVKSKTYIRQFYDCQSLCMDPKNTIHRNLPLTRSDPHQLLKAEELVCGINPQKSKPALAKSHFNTTIDKILTEELDNSNKVKKDIEYMIDKSLDRNCSVQICIEVPTKDRSTEVTKSLSKAVLELKDKSVSVEEIVRNNANKNQIMTIAVNTDPLGLLALLKISSETVKQLLSYMPNIPYYSYLSMINFPNNIEKRHYVCNICGAAFSLPSQLCHHIQDHYLGKTRDCCVCRHVLDMRHRPPGEFKCQYCDKRFTRAYCCELHQESCARQFGRTHDTSPSLMLLK